MNNIMATLADFQSMLERQNAAIDNIVEDIQALKDEIGNMGLTAEQEEAILSALENTTVKVENLASENPAVDEVEPPSPENPLPEDQI
jgi:multidrug resistance efflux pump